MHGSSIKVSKALQGPPGPDQRTPRGPAKTTMSDLGDVHASLEGAKERPRMPSERQNLPHPFKSQIPGGGFTLPLPLPPPFPSN